MNLKQEDYKKIEEYLKANSVKDSEFASVSQLKKTDYITIVQDGINKKILVNDIISDTLGDSDVKVPSEKIVKNSIKEVSDIVENTSLSLTYNSDFSIDINLEQGDKKSSVNIPVCDELGSATGLVTDTTLKKVKKNSEDISNMDLIAVSDTDKIQLQLNHGDTSSKLDINVVDETSSFAGLMPRQSLDDIKDLKRKVAINESNIKNTYSKTEADNTFVKTARLAKTTGVSEEVPMTQKAVTDELSKKQDKLISGSNIKTINNLNILGEGNINISEHPIEFRTIVNIPSNFIKPGPYEYNGGSVVFNTATKTFILRVLEGYDAYYYAKSSRFPLVGQKVVRGKLYVTDTYSKLTYIGIEDDLVPVNQLKDAIGESKTSIMHQKAVTDEINKKQDTLVSGTNIKTINGSSILGTGDLKIDTSNVLSVNSQTPDLDGNIILSAPDIYAFWGYDADTIQNILENLNNNKQDKLVNGVNIATVCGYDLTEGGDVTLLASDIGYKDTGGEAVDEVLERLEANTNNLSTTKQDTLISGQNIATINGNDLTKGGDITIEGGLTNITGEDVKISKQTIDNSPKFGQGEAVITEDSLNTILKQVGNNYSIPTKVYDYEPIDPNPMDFDGAMTWLAANVDIFKITPGFTITYVDINKECRSTYYPTTLKYVGLNYGDGAWEFYHFRNLWVDVSPFYCFDFQPNSQDVVPTDIDKLIQPNIYYIFGLVNSITIHFPIDLSEFSYSEQTHKEYVFQFTCGDVPVPLTLPEKVKWVNGTPIKIEANKTYVVSVINNLAVGGAF